MFEEEFQVSLFTLNEKINPFIPKGFPKHLIPQNICEKEFINASACLLINENSIACTNLMDKY